MTLYLPNTVDEALATVPSEGRHAFIQMAIIHYLNSAEGKKTLKLLHEGYKPMRPVG